jgi:hypothetical protein
MIGKNMPDSVEIDEARLTQILVNLIGNAVKFTPSNGQVKVRARFIPNEQNIKERLEENEAMNTKPEHAGVTEENKCKKLLKSSLQQRLRSMNQFKIPQYFPSSDAAQKYDRTGDTEENIFYHKDITNNDLQISEEQTQQTEEAFNQILASSIHSRQSKLGRKDAAKQLIQEATGGANFNNVESPPESVKNSRSQLKEIHESVMTFNKRQNSSA